MPRPLLEWLELTNGRLLWQQSAVLQHTGTHENPVAPEAVIQNEASNKEQKHAQDIALTKLLP